jgi:hypothetical protein
MIDARKLTLGNWVYVTDIDTVLYSNLETQLNIDNLNYLLGKDLSPLKLEFEPIRIDEDWLKKLGFKFDELTGYWIFDHFLFNLYFSISENLEGNLIISCQEVCHWEGRYVHEVQNLIKLIYNYEI